MRLVRIATAAVSVKVGDFRGNLARLRAVVDAADGEGVHLLVTPELAVSGYSLEDRIWWPDIARHAWDAARDLAGQRPNVAVLAGLPVRAGAMNYNAAALLHGGDILGLILKRHLPTYSIFYEGRNWTAWPGGVTEINGVPAGDLVFELPFGMVTAEICEDLWSSASPAAARVRAGAEIVCNPSASPFTPRKNEERKRLVQATAANLKAVYAYANLLGCDNSRLVFDGGGFIAAPDRIVAEGRILDVAPWTLATGVVDLDEVARMRAENTTWRENAGARPDPEIAVVRAADRAFEPAPVEAYAAGLPTSFFWSPPTPRGPARDPFLDELLDALRLGLRDYFEKVGVFERFLVALSGGRDSALCLLIAVAAAKTLKSGSEPEKFAERVSAVYLPNAAHSSTATEAAARALAEALGVPFRVIPIDDEARAALARTEAMTGSAEAVTPITKQNIQARVRGAAMLNWSNSAGGLVLVTSNLSEAAVGYTTTGGDNQGGYSPIANIPKTLVSELLAYVAKRDELPALEAVLAIPPSAELEPEQEDEKDLMPYAVLDDLLHLYARRRLSLVDCWRVACCRHPEHGAEQLRAWAADFAKRFAASQWKRDQHPVALKVMDLDLDPKTGFRFPVTQSIANELEELRAAEPPGA